MSKSQWHRFYTATITAPPELLFGLLSDMPGYARWLPPSGQFARTTDVEPYPVRLGSRYHDGKPDEPGKDWWGSVVGFQPPGSIDFHPPSRSPSSGPRSTCTSITPSKRKERRPS